MKTPALRIRAARKDAGLTQQAIASALGVTRPAVAQWESGSSKGLKAENLLRLCRLLAVRPEWLVFGEGPRESPLSKTGRERSARALAAIVAGVERLLEEESLRLPPGKKGELVAVLYGAFLDGGRVPTQSAIRRRLRRAA